MATHEYLEGIEPAGGVICFPRFRKDIAVDLDKFYQILLDRYKTYIGSGHWFEQNKRNFRLGKTKCIPKWVAEYR
jgi:hypothetical protein